MCLVSPYCTASICSTHQHQSVTHHASYSVLKAKRKLSLITEHSQGKLIDPLLIVVVEFIRKTSLCFEKIIEVYHCVICSFTFLERGGTTLCNGSLLYSVCPGLTVYRSHTINIFRNGGMLLISCFFCCINVLYFSVCRNFRKCVPLLSNFIQFVT